MYRERVWRDFVLELRARDYVRDANGMGPFSYCTAGVFLLGQVVEQATGERFDRYVQRRLFAPLGIDGAEWRRSRSGEIQSGGQLKIGDEALIKIGRLMLARGVWEGKQIVPVEWVETLFRPRHELSEFVRYGNLWWATPLRSQSGYVRALMMKGNGGNILAVVPDYDAVLLVQAENYNRDNAELNAFIVLTALLESLPPPQ
jgi:CubicO group peptidase (beta-lactamase class C family)